ncbi:MAG: hypothetical protein QOE98_2896, partial [Gaiellaceae bacterium]|nr:hypothetical protein [Gaiellaceae bacterium]
HEVGEWMELPLWIAPSSGEEAAMLAATDYRRASATGLTLRPLVDTVRATLAAARPVEGVGLTPDRERELLASPY